MNEKAPGDVVPGSSAGCLVLGCLSRSMLASTRLCRNQPQNVGVHPSGLGFTGLAIYNYLGIRPRASVLFKGFGPVLGTQIHKGCAQGMERGLGPRWIEPDRSIFDHLSLLLRGRREAESCGP